MRPRNFLIACSAFLSLALLPALAGSVRETGEEADVHAFMKDPDRCTSCHDTVPEEGKDNYATVTFVENIIVLCSGCHEDAHYREAHPVEIKPEFEVPTEFHLDNYHTMTCATCHDPHGEAVAERPFTPLSFMEKVFTLLSRRRRFPTYYLRQPSSRGELCLGCHRQGLTFEDDETFAVEIFTEYVGSAACRECHPVIYEEWEKTLHARNIQDVGEEPGAIRGRFEQDRPFPVDQIRYTVGEHWTQRYIVEGKKGLMVKPQSWSIIEEKWTGGGSFSRPWLRYCAGCHATALNPFEGRYLEHGTGCEACHGPGLNHVETTDQFEIVNPAVLAPTRSDMICEACHTSGHDRSGVYRYPVGYRPGEDLMRYFRGLVPKSGQGADSFTGDGTYEDRHRQFEFWSRSLNILEGLSCDICTTHSRPPEGTEQEEYVLSTDEMCGTCHKDVIEDLDEHVDHPAGTLTCLDCHPPLLNTTRDAFSVHDHKFQFNEPPSWIVEGKDPCARCHPEMLTESAPGLPGK